MKIASLRGMTFNNNEIFNDENTANRDNSFAPYICLRERLEKFCIVLNTLDLNSDTNIAFELHHDVQEDSNSSHNYLLMLESHLISRSNGDSREWSKYRKIFTWRDDLVDGDKFIKINIPNKILMPPIDGWSKRDKFCVLIAGNKSLSFSDERDLYKKRVDFIRWFEKHHSHDFELYGVGWDLPNPPVGKFRNLHQHVWRHISRHVNIRPFPSYIGRVQHKREVLERSRFAICYENVCDLPGYISEKLFDCFISGCLPIYRGADNVTDHVPADCFIDSRNFEDKAEIYKYIKSMPEKVFVNYQENISSFLESSAGQKFGMDFFADTIVTTIVSDLGT